MKDSFGRSIPYSTPDVSNYTDEIKSLINAFIDNVAIDRSDEEILGLLTIAESGIHLFIDFVLQHKPVGLDRVDGPTIRPLLREVVAERIEAIKATQSPELGESDATLL